MSFDIDLGKILMMQINRPRQGSQNLSDEGAAERAWRISVKSKTIEDAG